MYLSLTYVNLIPASLTGLVVSRDLFLVYAGIDERRTMDLPNTDSIIYQPELGSYQFIRS